MYDHLKSDEHRDFNHHDEFYKTLIKPIRDDFISKLIEDATIPESYSPWDKDLTYRERWDPTIELKMLVRSWASKWMQNFNKRNFPFVYIMNGNSDYLNDLFHRVDNIAFKKGDYSYYSKWHYRLNKPCQILTEPREVEDMVVSWPGYSNGDNTELDFALQCNPKRLHLDCAYLGLVEPATIDVANFQTVSISLSKSLAIPYNRISILFSKTELPDIEILNKIGYVNLSAVHLAIHLLKNIPHDYWWNTYGSNLENVCRRYELTPTKSMMFAYDKHGRRLALAPYLRAESFYYNYLDISAETYAKISDEIAEFYKNRPVDESYFKIVNCHEVLEALPTFKKWCTANKINPIKVAYISTPANTRQSPHMDDGPELFAINFPVINAEEIETEMWDEDGLASVRLITKGTQIPYYRYLVKDVPVKARYILDRPVILNIKKVHSVVNNTDKPRVSLSFRFYNDPWHLINGKSNG